MRFSVLVPVYNVEEYLNECVESIINQTYDDYEVILVDDGSTDSSGRICDTYLEKYPKKVRVVHKKNQGLISTRRTGIDVAEGEFCVFVDSDDFVDIKLLETINCYLDRENDVDMLLYSFMYNRNGQMEERFKIIASDGQIWQGERKKDLYRRLSCTSDITSIWTKAIRTSILKSDPTDYMQYYDKNMAEDLLQSLYPLTKARKVMYADKVLYYYRINDESISRSFYPNTIGKKNTIHAYEKVLEYLSVWNMDTQQMREKVIAKWFNEAMHMLSKYYESARNKADIIAVLDYDWDSMLPQNASDIQNVYENKDYQRLYMMWKTKDYKKIKTYFAKKKFYKKIKVIKRMLMK